MSAQSIFLLIITIVFSEFLFTKYLGFTNIKYWSDIVPPELEWIYNEKEYIQSQKYEREKFRFWLLSSVFSFILLLLMLVFGWFWALDTYLRGFDMSPISLWLTYFWIIFVVQTIIGVPFSYYSTFVIEEKYGFNKMTHKLFFLDMCKSLLLSGIIGALILGTIIYIYTILGSSFWLYAWGIMIGFMLFFMMFYSTLIVPLFNTQTPLEDWELKEAIENFAKKVDFQLDNIYVIDGSKRSSKANAYFSGIGPKKRIVLYDTLIADLSTDELVAVLAHEIGHYKKKHTYQMFAFWVAQTGLLLYVFSLALGVPDISLALWATQSSFHVWAVAFGMLFTPISMVLGMVGNMMSRKNEYEADAYAKKYWNATDLINALKKLSINNLSNLRPSPQYEFFYYSHPTVLKRIAVLKL